jgi:hypothetical protein
MISGERKRSQGANLLRFLAAAVATGQTVRFRALVLVPSLPRFAASQKASVYYITAGRGR